MQTIIGDHENWRTRQGEREGRRYDISTVCGTICSVPKITLVEYTMPILYNMVRHKCLTSSAGVRHINYQSHTRCKTWMYVALVTSAAAVVVLLLVIPCNHVARTSVLGLNRE